MSSLVKIIAAVAGILYAVSPIDLLPDFLPVLGRFDDLIAIGVLLFYLWTGRLPFWKRRQKTRKPNNAGPDPGAAGKSQHEPFDPHKVLGLERGASHEEVRQAYRAASQKYHPDKVAHLGEEFQELARLKFLDIQKAYEQLREK